jgi:hypothetical protein
VIVFASLVTIAIGFLGVAISVTSILMVVIPVVVYASLIAVSVIASIVMVRG